MMYDTNFSRDYMEQLESILGAEWVNSATNIEDKVLYEIKKLRRENEQMNIAISEIYAATYNESIANWKQIIRDIAQDALNEVTK